jgi:hypothetical protein
MDDAWLIGTVSLSAFNQVGFLVNHQVGLDEFSRYKYISSLIKIEAASKGKWQLIWATSWCKWAPRLWALGRTMPTSSYIREGMAIKIPQCVQPLQESFVFCSQTLLALNLETFLWPCESTEETEARCQAKCTRLWSVISLLLPRLEICAWCRFEFLVSSHFHVSTLQLE